MMRLGPPRLKSRWWEPPQEAHTPLGWAVISSATVPIGWCCTSSDAMHKCKHARELEVPSALTTGAQVEVWRVTV